jgi:hypothetical protein
MHPRTWPLFVLVLSSMFVVAAPADASPAGHRPFTISGLAITPPVGGFGATPVGSCNLVTDEGCQAKTFTVENVGARTIFIDGFGIANAGANNFALVSGTPGSGCEFLPLVAGHWALFPGSSCIISVVSSPPKRGLTSNELEIWYGSQSSPIAIVSLLAVGV